MASRTLAPTFPSPPEAVPGDLVLWWLGQAGFAIRSGESLLIIDPYLTDTLAEKYRGTVFPHRRMVPAPVDPTAVSGVDAVLCTHGHTDHMDPGSLRALQVASRPEFVVPRAERVKAVDRGVPPELLVGVTAGDEIDVGSVRVRVVPAAHEELTTDAEGDYMHLGYVLDLGGVRVYHSGDCVPFDGQASLLSELNVDVALLPVNGRDARRSDNGVPGNFHWHEAVALCRDAQIPTLVCHHWGMFDFNTVDPDDLRRDLSDAALDLHWVVPDVGGAYLVSPNGRLRATV